MKFFKFLLEPDLFRCYDPGKFSNTSIPSTTMVVNQSLALATSIPTGTISAHIGSPPNTTDDYYIAKCLLMAFGLDTDPVLGVSIAPPRSAKYVHETRGLGIIMSMSLALAVMVTITGLRPGVRVFRRGLMVGWDDMFIIPGVVRTLLSKSEKRHQFSQLLITISS